MDIKLIIQWSLKHWWWFVISVVVCLLLGGVYYLFKTPSYDVQASLMLRQSDKVGRNQEEMLQMMGIGGKKIAGDEVIVLSSRDLLGRVVDTLGLTTIYKVSGKRYDLIQYPNHDITVTLLGELIQTVSVKVVVRQHDYSVHVKSHYRTERFTLKSLDKPLHTFVGDIKISAIDDIQPGTYSATIMSRTHAINLLAKQIMVKRQSRESNIITISATTTSPLQTMATINMLLDLYNEENALDKNFLAVQSETLLSQRLELVSADLNRIEAELETYKREQQIGDLDAMAANYQQTGEAYELQVAELTEKLDMVDLLEQHLLDPEKRYVMLPGDVGMTDATLKNLLQDYNKNIAERSNLLLDATEQNPLVVQLSTTIDQKRVDVLAGLAQTRKVLMLRRQFTLNHQNEYNARLASMPETQRRCQQLQREKETVEKQYIYLIEKREENAMMLASEMVPAKVVDRAQCDAKAVSPKLMYILFVSLVLGCCFPLCVFFFGLLRKEYL